MDVMLSLDIVLSSSLQGKRSRDHSEESLMYFFFLFFWSLSLLIPLRAQDGRRSRL